MWNNFSSFGGENEWKKTYKVLWLVLSFSWNGVSGKRKQNITQEIDLKTHKNTPSMACPHIWRIWVQDHSKLVCSQSTLKVVSTEGSLSLLPVITHECQRQFSWVKAWSVSKQERFSEDFNSTSSMHVDQLEELPGQNSTHGWTTGYSWKHSGAFLEACSCSAVQFVCEGPMMSSHTIMSEHTPPHTHTHNHTPTHLWGRDSVYHRTFPSPSITFGAIDHTPI